MKMKICNIKINDNIKNQGELIKLLLSKNDAVRYWVTPNAHILNLSDRDKKYREALNNADLTTVDGFPIQILTFLKYRKIIRKITGSDVTRDLLEGLNQNKYNFTFMILGTHTEVETELFTKYPLVNGYYKGGIMIDEKVDYPIKKRQIKYISKIINTERPDIIFCCLSNPKSESLAYELKKQDISTKWILCIGASLDFLTGYQKRAPQIMQKLFLEWLYRIITSRGKLKRYLGDFIFLVKITLTLKF